MSRRFSRRCDMPEHDDPALELRLRQVLTDRLAALPLDLTVEDVERRRVADRRARATRRRRPRPGVAAPARLPAGPAPARGARPPPPGAPPAPPPPPPPP